MTSRADALAELRARRARASARADELQSQYERFPHREIKRARDDAARLVGRYDEALATMRRKRR